MRIFNVGTNDVNLYLLDSGSHGLLIDSGYPGKLNDLGREMRKTGFKIRDIDYLIITHFHIDHAGAVQELKEMGIKFILFDMQLNHIDAFEKMAVSKWPYKKLEMNDNVVLGIHESRDFLSKLNINGQVLATPGHSGDSISLLLDTGEVFTGDLPAEFLIMDESSVENRSWINLKKQHAKFVYPGH